MKPKRFNRLTPEGRERRMALPANAQHINETSIKMQLGEHVYTKKRIYKVVGVFTRKFIAECIWPEYRVKRKEIKLWHMEVRQHPSGIGWETISQRHPGQPATKTFISYPYWLCLFKLAWCDICTDWTFAQASKTYDNADLKATYYDEGCTPKDAVDEELSCM